MPEVNKRQIVERKSAKRIPQGLKPFVFSAIFGTTEVVP
jgi:hypothetical protein